MLFLFQIQSNKLISINYACNDAKNEYYAPHTDAGWSSLVARRAHNPKVVGSNPVPATRIPSPR